MFNSSKFSWKVPVPLMSNILSRPCSVMSTPSLVRPCRWAIHTELLPEVIVCLIYLERSCEERYSSRAEMPRMTLIMRFERSSFSTIFSERRLSPTQISDIGMPFFRSTYCVMAGSRIMSLWLDIMRNLPSMALRLLTPSYEKLCTVWSRHQSTALLMMMVWNSSMLLMLRRASARKLAFSSGKRALEMTGTAGWREISANALAASSSLYGQMASNCETSSI